jgi:hypothetical protein
MLTGRKSRAISYGTLVISGLIDTGPMLPITNELPSAGWRAEYSRPIEPFAPDLFSTITVWPQI